MRTSGIGNQEIWTREIGRFLHLKAEIINLKLDDRVRRADPAPKRLGISNGNRRNWILRSRHVVEFGAVQSELYDFGSEMQDSSDF